MSPEERAESIRSSLKAEKIRQELKALKNDSMGTKYVDEMPEWLDDSRSVVKNLTNNNEEALKVLQERHPDAEFTVRGEEIYGRKKGERDFGRLDPSFSPISKPISTLKDAWNDVKDLGMDAVQAGAEIGGTALGAVAGLGAGSIPAAMAGGAAGGATASTLKQLLRQRAGISDEVSLGDIAKDAAIGGLIPGATGVAGKGLKMAYQGASKAAPGAFAKTFGVKEQLLEALSKKGNQIAKWDELDAADNLQKIVDVGDQYIGDRTKHFEDAYKAIDSTADQVDTADIFQSLKSEIEQAAAAGRGTGVQALKGQADNLDGFLEQTFGKTYQGDKMPVSLAREFKQAIKEDFLEKNEYGHGFGKGSAGKKVREQAQKAIEMLDKRIDAATKGQYGKIQEEYAKHGELVKFLKKNLPEAGKAETFAGKMNKGKVALSGQFQELPPELRAQLMPLLEEHGVYQYFNPGKGGFFESTLGKTPIEKAATAIGTTIGSVAPGIGTLYGGAAGRASGAALVNPRTVNAMISAAKKGDTNAQALMKAIEGNPQLLRLIYGAEAATLQE